MTRNTPTAPSETDNRRYLTRRLEEEQQLKAGDTEKVVYTVYQSDANGAFTVGGNLIGTMTFLGNPFSDSIAGRLETDQLYSLTRIATVWSTGDGQAPGITSLTHMPEPTSLLLLEK